MARMNNNKFGCVSATENQCLGDLERWLKEKRKQKRRFESKQKRPLKGAFNRN